MCLSVWASCPLGQGKEGRARATSQCKVKDRGAMAGGRRREPFFTSEWSYTGAEQQRNLHPWIFRVHLDKVSSNLMHEGCSKQGVGQGAPRILFPLQLFFSSTTLIGLGEKFTTREHIDSFIPSSQDAPATRQWKWTASFQNRFESSCDGFFSGPSITSQTQLGWYGGVTFI